MPLDLILSYGKIPIYTSWERVGNVIDDLSRKGSNESRVKDSPSTKWKIAFLEGGWAGRCQSNLSLGCETILECGWTTSWPTAPSCGKETGILPHYYFPQRTWNFTPKRKRTSENHSNDIRFHKSGPANNQHTNHHYQDKCQNFFSL